MVSRHILMLTMHSYHSLIKSALLQKKLRLQEVKKHAEGREA